MPVIPHKVLPLEFLFGPRLTMCQQNKTCVRQICVLSRIEAKSFYRGFGTKSGESAQRGPVYGKAEENGTITPSVSKGVVSGAM